MTISGKAVLAGVAGWPISHSLSPRLFGYWLQKYGIDGVYVPLAIEPENFAAALRALPDLGFAGINVTIPHKEAAFQTVDETDPATRRLKAVNTVMVGNGGRLIGSNTDGFGFLENLRASLGAGYAPRGPVTILGAGGAARAIVGTLQAVGATDIRLANQTRERADILADDLGPGIHVVDWEGRADALADTALLVNATALGMTGQEGLELDLAKLPSGAAVTDIVYTPLETPLLADARARGLACVDGLGMLLHQARPGFEAWFGVAPEVDDRLRDHMLAALAE